jgi:sulfur-oxidizing protein SoxY
MGITQSMKYILTSVVLIVERSAAMLRHSARLLCIASLLAAFQFGLHPTAAAAPDAYDPWPGLVEDIFKNRAMNDGGGMIAIEMPYRAEDAAIVPVTLRVKLPPGDTRRVRAITLVIDQNPAPMAARFELGQDSSVSEISTRVRVNSYTDVHAVAELSDGELYMTKTYVKASGGCSAPAAKNADEAKARLGQMRFRQFAKSGEGPASGAREAQIMIGHPNNSGLQMDQLTHLYIPPFFVNELRVWQDDSLVLAMEGGISISEDPNIRFTYVPNGAKRFRVEAKDTEGHVFQNEWKTDGSGI